MRGRRSGPAAGTEFDPADSPEATLTLDCREIDWESSSTLADPSNNALVTSGALCKPPYDAIGLCGIDRTTYDDRGVTLASLRTAGTTDVAGGFYDRAAQIPTLD
jgi:hypothetical protein